MAQEINKQNDTITSFIENSGFIYDFTEKSYNRTSYWFRSKNLRYLLVRINDTLSKKSPNFIIIDAEIDELPHDSISPKTDNCILQCIVNDIDDIKKSFELLKIDTKTFKEI